MKTCKFALNLNQKYRSLNQNYTDVTTKGESLNIPISKWATDDGTDTDTEI